MTRAKNDAKFDDTEKSIRLDVPFYRQHYDFTCGPASLMMAMKYFDQKIALSKELEMDIWGEATLVESYGTSRYGLACSASKRGFLPSIITNVRGIEWISKLSPPLNGLDHGMLKFFFEEQRRRCLKLGVPEMKGSITIDLIRKWLSNGAVPLLLSNTAFFSKENLPHWMVITRIDQRYVYLNNPLGKGKGRKVMVRIHEFPTFNGYKGDECVIEVKLAQMPETSLTKIKLLADLQPSNISNCRVV